MIAMAIASAIQLATIQTAAADQARTALRACIKTAAQQAKADKLAPAALADFVHQQCATSEASLKSALWAMDSKNKVSRKQSESDAAMQIDDFVAMAVERYEMETSPQN